MGYMATPGLQMVALIALNLRQQLLAMFALYEVAQG